jgi:hypothetical protein
MKHSYQMTSSGPRHVAKIAHRGHAIDIITGYDIVSDSWPYHIVIDGKKMQGHRARAETMDEAIDAGFDIAIRTLDGSSGFQGQVL